MSSFLIGVAFPKRSPPIPRHSQSSCESFKITRQSLSSQLEKSQFCQKILGRVFQCDGGGGDGGSGGPGTAVTVMSHSLME